MPKFNILYLVEKYNDGKTDNRIIILYDSNEEKYYYYGTRNPVSCEKDEDDNDKYIEYSGKYSEHNIISFLKYSNDLFRNTIDTELHSIEIEEDEYDEVTFAKLFKKMNNYTEIFAYENVNETEQSITEKIRLVRIE
uniref:Uncharacterized protein n=1 Tax=viral metagenome TaxID=1070528 RepID=A0A6C0HYJ9_9ZZZZ